MNLLPKTEVSICHKTQHRIELTNVFYITEVLNQYKFKHPFHSGLLH